MVWYQPQTLGPNKLTAVYKLTRMLGGGEINDTQARRRHKSLKSSAELTGRYSLDYPHTERDQFGECG